MVCSEIRQKKAKKMLGMRDVHLHVLPTRLVLFGEEAFGEEAMKERPILFSAPMVRAILDGTKTQTRRAVKARSVEWRCPYGVPGDRLWVRETWAPYKGSDEPVSDLEDCDAVRYASDEVTHLIDGDHAQTKGLDMYCVPPHREMPRGPHRWRPSIFMPRWASRITLEVTEVRAELLRSISDSDALAEGMRPDECTGGFGSLGFARRFHAIYPDVDNPWVWAITFKRVQS
jgi:hypothetical protein